ncbi:hypothetical protein [Nitrosospira lacus]|nr:hypothetical protein [Nitrosospira lacus]
MKKPLSIMVTTMLACLTLGCATIVTEKAELGSKPSGVRIYPPKVYLLVDTTANASTLVYAPDYQRAYDVKPLTILAKQDFKIETDEGQLKSLVSNQDTTAILTFFQSAGDLAAKAAGVAVSASTINGTFGLESGIYLLGDDGIFQKVAVKK